MTKHAMCDIICEKYGEVLKWGRLRALPAADTASNKEWQRSKFLSEQRLKSWAPQQDEEASPEPKSSPCISLINLIFFMEKYSSGRRGVTRNFSVILELPFPNPLFIRVSLGANTILYVCSLLLFSPISESRWSEIYPERYRSGHNGVHSKCICEQSREGSNPSLSAIASLQS